MVFQMFFKKAPYRSNIYVYNRNNQKKGKKLSDVPGRMK